MLVVGGGAAGLEAARVLATQGHAVTIWESGTELGGVLAAIRGVDTVLDAQRSWLLGEVAHLGVAIELGRTAASAAIVDAGFDDVIIATVARWHGATVPGHDLPHVVTPTTLGEVLAPGAPAIENAAVVLGGGKPGLTLATAFRSRGATVTIVEPTRVFGTELGMPGRFRMVADAEAAGIVLVGEATLVEITPDAVVVDVGDTRTKIPARTVVVATRSVPNSPLVDELRTACIAVHIVGDAREARGFEGITRDAEDLARTLAI